MVQYGGYAGIQHSSISTNNQRGLMKIEGKTIPAPQNIKRREAYLLTNADKLPTTYVQAQLLRIAMIRTEKKLRWDSPINIVLPDIAKAHQEERKKKTAAAFANMPQKQTFVSRVKGMFRPQRGQ